MSNNAFLFPGQGAQHVGMGQQAYEESASVRELFERANKILDYDLAKLCFEGPAEQLNSTVHSQPALYVCSMAGLQVLAAENADAAANCGLTAGLSLGEYTAMVFSGVMDFESGLRLVQQRGLAMQAASDATPSGMVSVIGLEPEALEQLCREVTPPGEKLQIANYLCPGTLVVSGGRAGCEKMLQAAPAAGAIKAVPVEVSGAFHTAYMESAVPKLRAAIADVELSRPRIPVVCNVDGESHEEPDEIRELLMKQVVSPVLWEKSLRHMIDAGCTDFYEVGAGRVLRGLLKRVNRKVACHGVSV